MKQFILVLFIYSFVVSFSRADTFCVSGFIKHHTERIGPGIRYNLTEPFWVRFDGTNWYARFKAVSKPNFTRDAVYEFGWDGKLLRMMDWDKDPEKVRKQPAKGVIRRSPIPVNVIGHEISVVWCTLLSGPYFRSLNGVLAEPPGAPCLGYLAKLDIFKKNKKVRHLNAPRLSSSYFKVPVRIERGRGTPPFDVPQRVIYYDYVLPFHAQLKQFPENPAKLRKAAVFEVLEWTNSFGVTYPRRGRFINWSLKSTNRICVELECIVTNFAKVSEPVNPIPDLRGNETLFAEYRFIPEVPELWGAPDEDDLLQFSYITNHWLSDEEVKALPEYRNAMKWVREALRSKTTQRMSRFFLVVLLLLVALPAAYLTLQQLKKGKI